MIYEEDFAFEAENFARGARFSRSVVYNGSPCVLIARTANNGLCAWMYAYTMNFGSSHICGRSWEELKEDLRLLCAELSLGEKRKMLIFIEDLGFFFQFLKFQFEIKSCFFKNGRDALECELAGKHLGIIFRCVRSLTGKTGEEITGIEEELQSSRPITPADPYDHSVDRVICDRISDYILHIRADLPYSLEYRTNGSIPTTKTGLVRTMLRNSISRDRFYDLGKKAKMDIEVAALCMDAYRGGSCGCAYPDMPFYSVFRYDIVSQYSYELLTRNFPMDEGKIIRDCTFEDLLDMLEEHRRFIVKIGAGNYKIQPGKVPPFNLRSPEEKFVFTDVDFRMFLSHYEVDRLKIENVVVFYKSRPLWREARDLISDLYAEKTILRNRPGADVDYKIAKSKLNSIGGVLSRMPNKNSYDSFGKKIEKSPEAMIEEFYESPQLPFQIGTWMTAYARETLFRVIDRLDPASVIYWDTDSVCSNDQRFPAIVAKENEFRKNFLKKCGYDLSVLSPSDANGQITLIGQWDLEFENAAFKAISKKIYFISDSRQTKTVICGVVQKIKDSIEFNIDRFSAEMVIRNGLRTIEKSDEPFSAEINGCSICEKSYSIVGSQDFTMNSGFIYSILGKIHDEDR